MVIFVVKQGDNPQIVGNSLRYSTVRYGTVPYCYTVQFDRVKSSYRTNMVNGNTCQHRDSNLRRHLEQKAVSAL